MANYINIPLLSLSRWENDKKPGTGYEVRVVHVTQDGKSKGVGVEKVYFYSDGKKTIGKPLFGKDLNTIWKMRAEIKDLMDNPPPVPPEPEPDTTLEGGGLGGGSLGGGSIGGGTIEREDF
jgi:hypothetical protein